MELECIKPNEIEDSDLLAYLAGEAAPAAVSHINACTYCQQEAEIFRQMDSLLSQASYREACPDSDILWQYANGELTHAKRLSLSPHLATCRDCQQDLRQLAAAVFVDKHVSSIEAAPSFLTRIQEMEKKILQALMQPPLLSPTMGLRGEADKTVIYRVGSYQILLSKESLTPAAKIWQVEGQLIHEGEPDKPLFGTAILLDENEIVTRVEVDEVGYFLFANVNSGKYIIYIDLANVLLSLSDFTIP